MYREIVVCPVVAICDLNVWKRKSLNWPLGVNQPKVNLIGAIGIVAPQAVTLLSEFKEHTIRRSLYLSYAKTKGEVARCLEAQE